MYSGRLVFSPVMDHLPLKTFRRCVQRYHGNRHIQSFTCLDQLLCMAFAQLTFRESLRDIEVCLRAHQDTLYHMDIRGGMARNTLANANQRRDWRIYGKRCEWPTLTSVCRGVEVPGQKFPDSRLRVAAGGLLQRALEPGVGLDPIHLARLQKRRDLTPRGGASSWPANSAFFAVSFTGRIRFSTKFVSISTRPS